jgi:hypothetical protein
MIIETDSLGTPLPKTVWLMGNSSIEESMKALAINSFLLAARTAKIKNKTIIYSRETKTAQITDKDGLISTISHP